MTTTGSGQSGSERPSEQGGGLQVGAEWFSYADLAEVLDGLTKAQRDALAVLTDGREHHCWNRSSDPTAQAGKGSVNSKAVRRLIELKLARQVDYGGPFYGGTAEVTDLGQAVWDAI